MVELSKYIILLPCVTALIIGFFVKNIVEFIPNKFIPLICGVIGLIVNVWINMSFTPEIFVSGLVSGIAATGMFELVKNLTGDNKNEKS